MAIMAQFERNVRCIPPPGFCDGWLCFCGSLMGIGALTAVVGDLAALLGCVLEIGSAITAITLVALGTSLPVGH